MTATRGTAGSASAATPASERSSAAFYRALGATGLAELASEEKTRADLELVRRWCGRARDVLDLACGYGRIAVPLALAGWNVRGIDLDAGLIRAARRAARAAGANMRFDVGSMLDLPYAAAAFDRVLCLWSSFNHLLSVTDQRRAVAEMRRVLRPRGVAVIESVDAAAAATRRRLAREGFGPRKRLATWTLDGATLTHFFHDRDTLAEACTDAGWRRVDVGVVRVHGVGRLVARLRA